jgi:ParB-like chromosome segregation protein Spo0J
MNGTPRIELVPVAGLVPYDRNARTHSPEQVAQIAASIREFGWTNPVLIDEANSLIAGHGRLAAALELGLAEVPAIRLVGLSEVQRRALRIADNKLGLNAGWDDALLALELGDLQGLGFDLGLTGFGDIELGALFASSTIDPPEEFKEIDDTLPTEHSCPRCSYRWSGKADAAPAPVDKADAA